MTRILVVDDHEQVRNTVGACLRMAGYTVDLASSGEQALEMIEGGLLPDLIVVDLLMPKMDGNELLQRLASSRVSTVPKMLLTAALHELREDLRCEVVESVEKPVGCRDLLQAVEDSLRARV